jgi:D-beta-D-heptose 7-phosphate kinase/D-beta-D-heptose 1-phosphate adenosyltransferase
MNKKILVIGDSCRDVYVYCSCKRLAPDKPIPVLEVLDKKENSGMAKNVYENIKSIYKNCDIKTNKNWFDITKTRYVDQKSNHMFLRVDSNNQVERINVKEINYNYDIIVISDYNKGFLTEEDIEYICSKNNNVIIDTKKILGNWIKKAKFIKINNHEYEKSKKFIDNEIETKIIKTCGDEGCYYNNQHFPAKKIEVIDVSGAGDSFLAGFVVRYLKTNEIKKSIQYANSCSLKVIQEKGVTTIK